LARDVEKAKAMRAKGATWPEVGGPLGVNADTVRLASKCWQARGDVGETAAMQRLGSALRVESACCS
jgi:hypothetical protein